MWETSFCAFLQKVERQNNFEKMQEVKILGKFTSDF